MSTPLDVFLDLSKIPTYLAAQFQSKDVLRVTSTFPDHDRNVYRKATQAFVVNGDTVLAPFAPDVSDITVSTVSPSGKRLAVFREVGDRAAPQRFVEVWTDHKLEASLEVTKTHGAFYTDDIFSLTSFSPSEDALVYTAEAKPDDRKDSESLDKFHFVPPLGEGYPGKKKPGLYIFRWSSEKPSSKALRPAESSFDSLLLTQPVFVTDTRVITIGYSYTPDNQLLGVKHCPNRLAGVYEITLPADKTTKESDADEVRCAASSWTPSGRSCRCPRVVRVGDDLLLVYIANSVGGPHASCSSLHVVNLDTKEEITSLQVVWDPKLNEFPGLYTITLPAQPFLVIDGKHYIATTSMWRSRSTVILVSLKDASVVDLTPDDDDTHFSWTVLGTDGRGQLVCSRSSFALPPELLLGKFGASQDVQWQTIAKPNVSDELRQRLSTLQTSIIPVEGRYPVETIIVKDKTAQPPLPCIHFIHGGPHGVVTTDFSASNAALALEGYVISIPNYTGSVGFGETYVRELLGKVGSLEVEDCLESVQQLIQAGTTKTGPGQQFLVGGSHGGFILGHLLGQYPEIFSAASIRNPVTHLGDISGTDIPDWYFEECGIPYTPTSLMTPELYQRLYQMSPIAHVDKVRDDIPIHLYIGEKDARVANSQGKTYYHALKGRGKNITMLTFKEDSHSLDSVEASRVMFKATRELFEEHRK